MRDWSSKKLPLTGKALEIIIIALAASVFFAETSHALSINAYPTSFSEIEKVLGIGKFVDKGTIPKDLEKAQCGGFDYDQSVQGKIPQVEGLPGRDGDYFGNIPSGMAVRDDAGFIAPGTDVDVCGYRTACRPDHQGWWDGGVKTTDNANYYPPFFSTFPCQRPLGDATPDKDPVPLGRNDKDFDFTCGGSTMPADGHVCSNVPSGTNGGLCGFLNNRWLFGYYQKVVPVDFSCNDNRDPNGNGSQLIGPTLCDITLYSGKTECRYVTTEDAELGMPNRVKLRDEANNSQPDDPGLNNPAYRQDWITERQCCTFQNSDGTIYGPDGPGDTTGDNSNLIKNCVSCEDEECRYTNNSPDPRLQYYPPWVKEVDERSECYYCENLDTEEKSKAGCGLEGWSEKIYPCKKYLQAADGLTFHSREHGKTYLSYFRHYTGSYYRDKIQFTDRLGEKYGDDMDDNEKYDIPVSCYRMYGEKDYKTSSASNYEKACVIAAYYQEPHRNFYEMGRKARQKRGSSNEEEKIRGTQEGHGEYNSEFQDIPAMIRNTTFDNKKDLWYSGIGNAFSLTNGTVMKELYNENLSMVLLQPADSAHLQSTIQLYYTEEDEPDEDKQKMDLSPGALLRAFDDTAHSEGGDQRAIVEWWQRQETMANLLFSPPSIHLLLPPAWSVGLDPLDPLFTPEIVEDINIASKEDPRMQIIDVQLKADEDLIDSVKAFLLRALTPKLEEELIPVLVPLGSPTEFRALAEKWHGWAIAQAERGGEGADEAIDLAAKLEQYARHIEDVRRLRGEMVWFNNKLFNYQRTITKVIGEWLNEDVTAKYDEFRSLSDNLAPLKRTWKSAQSYYIKMHDKSSMPWCHNDRFTVPIYSLLDPWMWGRSSLDGNSLPNLEVNRGVNAGFDFTTLKSATGSLEAPVIDPIQVRIAMEILEPPSIYAKEVDVPTLPNLPPIPSIKDIIDNYESGYRSIYPDIGTGAMAPSIQFDVWSSDEIRDFRSSLGKIHAVTSGMENEYRLFWESQSMFSYPNPNSEDSPPQPKPFTEQDCYVRHDDTCVHAEMDLHERLMRFGSRPAILLKEDFASIESWRENPADVGYGIESCSPEDWACQLLHGSEINSREGWEVKWEGGEMPNLGSSLCSGARGTLAEQLRSCLFKETLIDLDGGEDKYPFATEKENIIPSFHIPDDIKINHEGTEPE
ncbi:MAG: hypothetical protein K9M03_02680 [Kiritimatiellales bacterium]|nr:hypothetical protein [Kiritimatiellales bacterium]